MPHRDDLTPLEYSRDWRDDALCREVGTDFFYPGLGENDLVNAARSVCNACEVQAECLDDAWRVESQGSENDIWGMRAGVSARQRRLYLRQTLREGGTYATLVSEDNKTKRKEAS
jgi:hypothetical protein